MSKSETCKANNHMRPEEYALWDVSRILSFKTGILYFDGRRMAERFKGVNSKFFYPKLKALVSAGWFIQLDEKQKRTRGGTYAARRYRVLSHDEWVATHGTCECRTLDQGDTVQSTANGNDPTVRSTTNTARPTANHHSLYSESPFARERHSSIAKSGSKSEIEFGTPHPLGASQTGAAESHSVSGAVCPAVRPTTNGVHDVPDYLEYDMCDRRWIARRNIGRGITPAEHEVMQRMNRERVRPQ
jgi:hypothetical protein